MSFVGTTGTSVSVPEGESSNVMKSTFGLSSSAAVPATYDVSGSTSVRFSTGVLFSTHCGRLNWTISGREPYNRSWLTT